MTTSADICNRALAQIAAQAVVTGSVPNLQGGGNASVYCNILYPCVVETMLREQDPEFARTGPVALVLSGNVAPQPFAYEYLYPTDCIRVRQVTPATWDQNDPQEILWSVADDVVSGNPTKVILTNVASAALVYTTSATTAARRHQPTSRSG